MTTSDVTGAERALSMRPMRFGGERRYALGLRGGEESVTDTRGAVLAYGFFDARSAEASFDRLGLESLGPAPALVRPLRLSAALESLPLPGAARALVPGVPLLAPFGRRRRTGFREITTKDPRISRLWDRFSVDIGVAIERNASYVGERIFDRLAQGYRIFIFEDGDRYAIRALCIFRTKDDAEGRRTGYVMELLHDRSVTGMRAASHLLGLALREMSDAGAAAALAWSLPHSGSFPILSRHAFLSAPRASRAAELRVGARVFEPELEELVMDRGRWYLSYLDSDEV
jgi:hypothetical protein